MEELQRAITDAATLAIKQAERPYPELQEAAEKWATHSLRTYSEETLYRALEISRSIVEFIESLGAPNEGESL